MQEIRTSGSTCAFTSYFSDFTPAVIRSRAQLGRNVLNSTSMAVCRRCQVFMPCKATGGARQATTCLSRPCAPGREAGRWLGVGVLVRHNA